MIPRRVRQRLVRAILALPGLELGSSHFSPDEAFFRSGRHIAQVDDARGRLEVRLTREEIRADREALARDTRVDLRQAGSDWIELSIASARDIPLAMALIQRAVATIGRRR